jgi:hypothetical protein
MILPFHSFMCEMYHCWDICSFVWLFQNCCNLVKIFFHLFNFLKTIIIIWFEHLFICSSNLYDYFINYDRLLYVLHMNYMKIPTFTGSKNRWRRTEPVLQFWLRALLCASDYPTRKYVFGELNSGFSVRVFTGSARDALSWSNIRHLSLTGHGHVMYSRQPWKGL